MSVQLLGPSLSAQQLTGALDHVFQANLSASGPAKPVCIWGTHGLGKTTFVRDYGERRGWPVVLISPAQFEEMGDLHGLPTRSAEGGPHTTFLPPQWVPTEPGPGILLLDDINRADDRILRGLMQLLQEQRLFSWALPPGWQVVATANPEGGEYSVTPLDDAMRTRMLHFSMRFELQSWLEWAAAAGVDRRGADFVMAYPELVGTGRSTPRSLSYFFSLLPGIPDLAAEPELVETMALSCLDLATAQAFLAYVRSDLGSLPQPEELLQCSDWPAMQARLEDLAHSKDRPGLRSDRLSLVCSRLALYVTQRPAPEPPQLHSWSENLRSLVLWPTLPGDLRFSLHQSLLQIPWAKTALEHPAVALALLQGI